MHLQERSSLREDGVSAKEPGHSPGKTGLLRQIAAAVPPNVGLIEDAPRH
jgi:hypothetical protein